MAQRGGEGERERTRRPGAPELADGGREHARRRRFFFYGTTTTAAALWAIDVAAGSAKAGAPDCAPMGCLRSWRAC
eukprot:5218596-Pyramimonas_sp.AAC.1